ncbi:hypothetical protein ACFWWS_36890, partial [Streptomyces sp. NPDC059083]|uniref:hypothetical protein n=1 Tax=Streptomyces sp. NPDC059083 TaxID=3346721 RepID=UPI0036772502
LKGFETPPEPPGMGTGTGIGSVSSLVALGGGSADSSAPTDNPPKPRNDPPPPAHHPEHPDFWAPDCAECTALLDQRIDFRHNHVTEAEPPSPYCDRHPEGTTDPCGKCGDRRRQREVFDAELAAAVAAKRTAEAKRAADVRAQAIANCTLCDADGYRGTALCDHDPGTADRARRGMAAVRAAMAGRPTEHTPDVYAEETADA